MESQFEFDMEEQFIKFFGEQSADANMLLLKKALPEKSIMIEFEGNRYLKGFLAHFFTASDLEFVKELIHQLIDLRIKDNADDHFVEKNFHLKRSLFTTAIVTYMRCFNSPKGKLQKLDIKHLLKKLPDDLVFNGKFMKERLLGLHERIAFLRNKYIAHADDNDFETVGTYMTLNYNGKNLEYSLNGIYLATYNFDEEEMQNWIFLISFYIKYLVEKQNELTDAFFKSISKEDLFRLATEAGAFEKK